ncbi:MAG TPA: metal ABC transporter permease [Tepidisphaeraceae bacterium]|nr:metal ABC transporter permease [Tepidisphaeraceae bacterium]
MMELFHQDFVRNAFLAGALVAVLTAIVGYFVVMRSEAFAAHALSHIGFAGATGAAVLGISSLFGMLGFTASAALAIGALEKRLRGRHIEIGMVLAFSLGLGVLFLQMYSNSASEAVAILFGSILSVDTDPAAVRWMFILGGAALVALAIMFRPLTFASIDPETAEARGVPVRFLSIAFMLLLAITVAEVVQIVGILLMFALLIAPPAIAQHLFRRPAVVILAAALMGIAFTWFGLLLAIWTGYPVSFFIAGSAAATYLIVVGLSHVIRPHHFRPPEHPDREFVDHPQHQHAHPHTHAHTHEHRH